MTKRIWRYKNELKITLPAPPLPTPPPSIPPPPQPPSDHSNDPVNSAGPSTPNPYQTPPITTCVTKTNSLCESGTPIRPPSPSSITPATPELSEPLPSHPPPGQFEPYNPDGYFLTPPPSTNHYSHMPQDPYLPPSSSATSATSTPHNPTPLHHPVPPAFNPNTNKSKHYDGISPKNPHFKTPLPTTPARPDHATVQITNLRAEMLSGLRRIEGGLSFILNRTLGSNIICEACNSALHTSGSCPYTDVEPPTKKHASCLKIFE